VKQYDVVIEKMLRVVRFLSQSSQRFFYLFGCLENKNFTKLYVYKALRTLLENHLNKNFALKFLNLVIQDLHRQSFANFCVCSTG
jgi:hypothetical protein